MFTDPISDMLTRIRNAGAAGKAELVLPYSKFKANLAQVFLKEGFISAVNEITNDHKMLKIQLKYAEGAPVIAGIKRVSKPGIRTYAKVKDIKPILGGQGIAIVTTSKGIMSDYQCRQKHIGGEVLCHAW